MPSVSIVLQWHVNCRWATYNAIKLSFRLFYIFRYSDKKTICKLCLICLIVGRFINPRSKFLEHNWSFRIVSWSCKKSKVGSCQLRNKLSSPSLQYHRMVEMYILITIRYGEPYKGWAKYQRFKVFLYGIFVWIINIFELFYLNMHVIFMMVCGWDKNYMGDRPNTKSLVQVLQ